MKYAANAVLALSRALYGKRLTLSQYTALLECKSLSEAASFLRTTPYGKELDEAGMQETTADALIELAAKHRFESFSALCRYELAIGSKFYQFYLMKNEIEQILRCTMSLLGGNSDLYLLQMDPFLDKHLRIDLFRLGNARSLQDVLSCLEKTPYARVYRSCLQADAVSYLTFELSFQSYYQTELKALVKKGFHGKEEKELLDLISRSQDIKLISSLERALRFYRDSVQLSTLSSPSFVSISLFSDLELRAISSCKSLSDLFERIEKSPYRDWVDPIKDESLQLQLEQKLFNHCAKLLRYSVYPSVVMYCFLFLSQTETANLVKILQGIKFQIPAQTVRDSLIL